MQLILNEGIFVFIGNALIERVNGRVDKPRKLKTLIVRNIEWSNIIDRYYKDYLVNSRIKVDIY